MNPRDEHGAALIICLMLVTALCALALGAMGDVATGLAMTRNLALDRGAFAAGASGIELALASGPFSVGETTELNLALGAGNEYAVAATIRYAGVTEIPAGGFSLGLDNSSLVAYHFDVVSIASGPRNARSVQRQGFYVLGPRVPETR